MITQRSVAQGFPENQLIKTHRLSGKHKPSGMHSPRKFPERLSDFKGPSLNSAVWDNWFVKANNRMLRYGLFAPKGLTIEQRGKSAKICCASSSDNGQTWSASKEIKIPGINHDRYAMWSGSCTYNEKANEFQLYFTLADKKNGLEQSLWTAKSKDGFSFDQATPLFNLEQNQIESLGYYLGKEDGQVSAFRDPYVGILDGEKHMVFATKAKENGEIFPAFGHAVANDSTWQLKKPIAIFKDMKGMQMEVPCLIRRDDSYYLFGSKVSEKDGARNTEIIAYKNHRLTPEWKSSIKNGGTLLPSPHFALHVKEIEANRFMATSFIENDLLETTLMEIKFNDDGEPYIVDESSENTASPNTLDVLKTYFH